MSKMLLSLFLLIGTPIPVVLAAHPLISEPGLLEKDLQKTELKIAIEKQRGEVEKAQNNADKLKGEVEMAKQSKKLASQKLKAMRSGNEKNRGLYYKQTQKEPLTKSGYFYDEAVMEKKSAEDALKKSRKSYDEALNVLKNEKRLFLEKVQRLKDYEEAAKA